jgi:hypothetical protein
MTNRLQDDQAEMRARESASDPEAWFTVTRIAKRWKFSAESVSVVLQRYRGRTGFLDKGSKGNLKTHTRAYSQIRISPQLLKIIESDLQK